MSSDEYSETSSSSWFSRIGNSFKGILAGIILILAAVVMLFWNEGRSVKQYKTLKEGAATVIPVSAQEVDPGNNGKLVHLTGEALTAEILSDDDFSVAQNAIKLKRTVDMYQWEEERKSESTKKLGGGEETKTTYSYKKKWSEELIDSGKFKQPGGHENPASMPFETKTWQASHVTLGAFNLSPSLIGMISSYEELPVKESTRANEPPSGETAPPEPSRQGRKIFQGGYYLGDDPANPKIGDLRVRFSVVKPTMVSIIARQLGNSFEPYITSAGGTIEMLNVGVVSADAMFAEAQASNKMLTWVLRLAGMVLMFIGFSLVLKPLSVLGDVVPLLGSLVAAGTGFVSLCLSLVISLVVIAVAWLFFRPLLGALLIAAAASGVYLLKRRLSRPRPK